MSFDAIEELKLNENQVAVAISNGAFGCHLGLIYPNEEHAMQIIHLGWHKSLHVQKFPLPEFDKNSHTNPIWLSNVMKFSDSVGAQVVSLVFAIGSAYEGDANGGIDYGINFYESDYAFKGEGEYSPEQGTDGLTCATFVSSLFSHLKIPLVDLNTWENHPKNEAWSKAVVCFMNAMDISANHINLVRKNTSGLRLRPEEIAATSEFFVPGTPAKFDEIQERANFIAENVFKICGKSDFSYNKPLDECQKSYYAEIAATG